jgi:hypothetical protein
MDLVRVEASPRANAVTNDDASVLEPVQRSPAALRSPSEAITPTVVDPRRVDAPNTVFVGNSEPPGHPRAPSRRPSRRPSRSGRDPTEGAVKTPFKAVGNP